MIEHDGAYKNIFSHQEVVADLLRSFVHEDWVEKIDYATLEKVSGSCSVVQWTEKWKQEGLQEGMLQGRQQGECFFLERQLIRRFGTLREEVRARLQQATLEQLEQWAENILDAATIEEVFKIQ